MGDKEQMQVHAAVDAAVSWLKSKGMDCVVLGVSPGGAYCMKSSVGRSYTWVMMDMAQAKLRQEIERDEQFQGDNQTERKE